MAPSSFLSLSAAAILVLACAVFGDARQASKAADARSRATVYDSDPAHPWNRVHEALFVRRDPGGREWGRDDVDPLLWPQSRHLLEGPSHTTALAALDAFLDGNAERRISDPVRRAVFQSDLWAVFDWAAGFDEAGEPARMELAKRIARVLRRVALPASAIAALPDNYAAAVASGAFPDVPTDPASDAPFLPRDLLQPEGAWVRLADERGESISPVHDHHSDGRPRFSVFLRLPGGRPETLAYLEKLKAFPDPVVRRDGGPRLNPSLPQFPAGTAVAFLRQATVLDDRGNPVATPLVESLQLRLFRSVAELPASPGIDDSGRQGVFEFRWSRERLFRGESGGLRALARDEPDLARFATHGYDPLDRPSPEARDFGFPALARCGFCHAHPGIYSVNSYTRIFTGPGTISFVDAVVPPRRLRVADVGPETDRAIGWKRGRASFGLLKGLWAALPR